MGQRAAKFTVTRNLPSWFSRQMMGGRVAQAGVAGQVTYAELYNDSTNGSDLYLWGLSWYSNPGDEGVPEWYKGKNQTGAAGGQFPLLSGAPVQSGVVGGFTNVTCVGNEIGSVVCPTANSMFWPYDFPIAIIAPGYSFGIHTAGTGELVRVGFWWQVTKEL